MNKYPIIGLEEVKTEAGCGLSISRIQLIVTRGLRLLQILYIQEKVLRSTPPQTLCYQTCIGPKSGRTLNPRYRHLRASRPPPDRSASRYKRDAFLSRLDGETRHIAQVPRC